MNPTLRLGLLGLAVALSACSTLESDKIDYKSAAIGSSLEVPPDLTQLSTDAQRVLDASYPQSDLPRNGLRNKSDPWWKLW